jgi:hypothetical protein
MRLIFHLVDDNDVNVAKYIERLMLKLKLKAGIIEED